MTDGPAPAAPDEGAVLRFVERFAQTLTDYGFPRMPARVFVALLTADTGRRTAADLAAVLRVSPAAVSGGVTYLTRLGLVVREHVPRQRRAHYRVRDDMWYEAIARETAMFARCEEALKEGVAAAGPDTPTGRRLEETRRFFEFIRAEFPLLLDRWRQRPPADRLAGPPIAP
ncbi:GbsR/MarR family transcriptional regulator [Streptomyces litchfieldiae]|uniref:MarR family transcriptional regulator n=1 Tax=Streptomyces litchfieldiae TaxID=3075543 RepID=A0ABU2MRE7_9ACTN|nr:MarR family transcriptional regulator [Streptomyces sp. DSM 44938]MDT0343463.1 MarR family transcriptional regulator [Streptomyces sp. DSM 44938]